MGFGYEVEENYECCLRTDLRQQAQKELREDEATRAHALTQMRDWIEKHPDIVHCRTDSVFLLRFLRTKKFCLPLAQEMLERYLTIRELFPHWFRNLDCQDPAMQDILDSGYIIPLPQRDDQGRKVIFSRVAKFDPYKYSSSEMARIHSIVVESLLDDEQNQIAGYSHVSDQSGILMAHVTLWSFSDIRKVLKCILNSTPMRHKSTQFVNVPAYANKVLEFFTNLLTDKLRNRITIHSSVEEMKKTVNAKILPKEYGGEVPLVDMIADFKKYLETKREMILALDDMKIEINRKAKFVNEMEDQQITGIAGSFRKLEVD